MKIIYVVTYGTFTDFDIMAAYADKERALKYWESLRDFALHECALKERAGFCGSEVYREQLLALEPFYEMCDYDHPRIEDVDYHE